MKVNFIKQPGGILFPASDIEADRLKRIKSGIVYEIDIKGGDKRNRGFHGKVFAFFNFCFQYWCADNTDYKFQCESAQFNSFRKDLTIKAGYFDWTVDIFGNAKPEARSLSFDSMDQEEFEACYSALIDAALATIFQGADMENSNKLYSFF